MKRLPCTGSCGIHDVFPAAGACRAGLVFAALCLVATPAQLPLPAHTHVSHDRHPTQRGAFQRLAGAAPGF